MTGDVGSFIGDPAVQTGGGGIAGIGFFWWIIGGFKRRMEKHEDDISETQKSLAATTLDLEKHKTYSEGVYAKTATIERVHERIDDMSKKTDEIYQLLVRGK